MKTVEQRLLARTKKGAECWICNYALASHGYPQMNVDGKTEIASRVAYQLWKGEIPPGLCVCHSCDNRRCVNPAHLWVGTNQDNMTDMMEKGRHDCGRGEKHSETLRRVAARGDDHWSHNHPESVPRGEKHVCAKLTEEDVLYIRMRAAEGFNQQKIAEAFNISPIQVSRIVRRESWKHVL